MKKKIKIKKADYEEWMNLAARAANSLDIEVKMEVLLGGVMMGISPSTSVDICDIDFSDLRIWLASPENARRYRRAKASVKALVEQRLFDKAFEFDTSVSDLDKILTRIDTTPTNFIEKDLAQKELPDQTKYNTISDILDA